jgi:hypothetical protein
VECGVSCSVFIPASSTFKLEVDIQSLSIYFKLLSYRLSASIQVKFSAA